MDECAEAQTVLPAETERLVTKGKSREISCSGLLGRQKGRFLATTASSVVRCQKKATIKPKSAASNAFWSFSEAENGSHRQGALFPPRGNTPPRVYRLVLSTARPTHTFSLFFLHHFLIINFNDAHRGFRAVICGSAHLHQGVLQPPGAQSHGATRMKTTRYLRC